MWAVVKEEEAVSIKRGPRFAGIPGTGVHIRDDSNWRTHVKYHLQIITKYEQLCNALIPVVATESPCMSACSNPNFPVNLDIHPSKPSQDLYCDHIDKSAFGSLAQELAILQYGIAGRVW